jgi:hypothetical protein
VNCLPFPISLSFWVELVGACNLIYFEVNYGRQEADLNIILICKFEHTRFVKEGFGEEKCVLVFVKPTKIL